MLEDTVLNRFEDYNATVRWTVARGGLTEQTTIFASGKNAKNSERYLQKNTPKGVFFFFGNNVDFIR